jgi:hypothetical protein
MQFNRATGLQRAQDYEPTYEEPVYQEPIRPPPELDGTLMSEAVETPRQVAIQQAGIMLDLWEPLEKLARARGALTKDRKSLDISKLSDVLTTLSERRLMDRRKDERNDLTHDLIPLSDFEQWKVDVVMLTNKLRNAPPPDLAAASTER